LQYRLRNKPKSIKIIAKSSSKNIFRWIFTYLYFAFDSFKKTWKKFFKNVKNVKKRDLNKKRKKTLITSMGLTIARSWIQLPVGSLSSAYYLDGLWTGKPRSTQPSIPPG